MQHPVLARALRAATALLAHRLAAGLADGGTGELEFRHRARNGRVPLIPGSPDTSGHGNTGRAKFWKDPLAAPMQTAPRRAR